MRFSRDYLNCTKTFSPGVKTAASVKTCVEINFEVVVLAIAARVCSSAKKKCERVKVLLLCDDQIP